MLESEIDIDSIHPSNPCDDNVEAMLKKRKKKRFERAKVDVMVFSASKKLQRRFSWKKTTAKVLAIVMIGVASGVMIGNWYRNYLTGLVFDYSNYKLEDYEMNSAQVLSSILGTTAQAGQDFSGLTETLKQKGMTPKNLSASQNIALANYNASLANSYSAIGVGKVATIGTQPITSIKKFDGETYTFESLSDGIMAVAKCAVMEKGASSVTVYESKPKKIEGSDVYTADWPEKGSGSTLKAYVEKNGMDPSRLLPYVLSSKTIQNEKSVVVNEEILDEKTVFTFTINLDPITSVLRYYKQVMQTSGLKDPPTFENVSIKIFVDADWNFVRTEVEEHYTVIFGIVAPCTGTLNTDYVFNQPVDLPIGGAQ